METKLYGQKGKQGVNTVFEPTHSLSWIVREDADLEAELNDQIKKGEEISTRVVNKVVDRIKSL